MNTVSTSIRRRRRPRALAPRRASLRGAVAGVIRGAILDAAERVFGERGFADAKMTDVAAGAGLAAGTLYNYFDNKESIFRALVEQRAQDFLGALEAAVAERRPEPPLRRITGATCAYIQSHAPMFRLFEQVGGSSGLGTRRACGPTADRLRARYLALYRSALESTVRAGGIRRELPLDQLTLLFTGALHELLRGWMLDGCRGRLSERADLLLRVFLEGAASKQRHK